MVMAPPFSKGVSNFLGQLKKLKFLTGLKTVFSDQFVCDLLPDYSVEVHHPLPQLASRRLYPSVLCSLALPSNRLVTGRGRGTAILLLGVTCYLATTPASAAVVFSLSWRAM